MAQVVNLTYDDIVQVATDVAGQALSDTTLQHTQTPSQLWDYLDSIPGYQTYVSGSGDLLGVSKTMTTTFQAPAVVDSTLTTTASVESAAGVAVDTAGKAAVASAQTGGAIGTSTAAGSFVMGEVLPVIGAAAAGVQLGVSIDNAIYAAHPDWWEYNVQNWDNFLLGHDTMLPFLHDTSTGITYIQDGAVVNAGNALNGLGGFNAPRKTYTAETQTVGSVTGNLSGMGSVIGAKDYLHEGEYYRPTNIRFSAPVVVFAPAIGSTHYLYFFPSSTSTSSVSITIAWVKVSTGEVVSQYTNTYNFNWSTLNGKKYTSPAAVSNGSYTIISSDSYTLSNLTSSPIDRGGYSYLFFNGSVTTTTETDLPGSTVSGTTPASLPLTTTNLQTNYPLWWGNRVQTGGVDADGNPTTITWLPVPMPTTTTQTQTQPVTGTNTQTATGAYPSAADQSAANTTTVTTGVQTSTSTATTGATTGSVPPASSGTGSSGGGAGIPAASLSNGLCMIYNPSRQQLIDFSQWLWSANFVEQIKKLFNNPMESIIGLHELYCTPTDGGTSNIVVGYLDSGMPAPWVSERYSTIDCGTISIAEFYGDIFDYAPMTDITLFLPFVGFVPLDVSDCMRGSVSVKYIVDVLTGATLAYVDIIRDGNTVHSYSYGCNSATTLPVSSGSYMGVVSALAGVALNVGTAIASGGATAPLSALGAVSSLTKGHTTVQHSGGYSGNTGAMDDKKPFVIISRQLKSMPASFYKYQGRPLHRTYTVGDCSGFTIVSGLQINDKSITDAEKNEIKALFTGGVIV